MSLKLKSWPKKSPYWYVRGTVQGEKVLESTGTRKREEAEAYRIKREREIFEHRVYDLDRTAIVADAAYAYMERTDQTRFLAKIIEDMGMLSLHEIDQATRKLYPGRSNATLV